MDEQANGTGRPDDQWPGGRDQYAAWGAVAREPPRVSARRSILRALTTARLGRHALALPSRGGLVLPLAARASRPPRAGL
jgi:hypothetical protein